MVGPHNFNKPDRLIGFFIYSGKDTHLHKENITIHLCNGAGIFNIDWSETSPPDYQIYVICT